MRLDKKIKAEYERSNLSTVRPLFVTPIFSRNLSGFEQLVSVVKNLRQNDKGKIKSNIGGWHSEENLHENQDFLLLRDKILNFSTNAFKYAAVSDDFTPVITNMWAIINRPGDYNRSHMHQNNYLSGVFYLKIPHNSGSLVFFDPRPQAEVISPPKTENEPINLSSLVNWDPKENDLIIFPSWLRHEVEINTSAEDRIVVSFNIAYREQRRNQ